MSPTVLFIVALAAAVLWFADLWHGRQTPATYLTDDLRETLWRAERSRTEAPVDRPEEGFYTRNGLRP